MRGVLLKARSATLPAVSAENGASLLTETYQLLLRTCASLRVELVRPAGGTPPAVDAAALAARPGLLDAAALAADPGLLDTVIDGEAARIQAEFGPAPRREVAASRLMHHYLWSVGLLMSGPWYLARRVPRIRPRDVRIDPVTAELALAPGGFTCLPDDRAAGMRGVRVVAHEEALRAELRSAFADHVRPLLAVAAPAVRRGPRALWGMAGDDLVSGIWYLGRMLGQEERSVRAAGALLPTGIPPFPAGADFRRLQGSSGHSHLTRTRAGCCLYYAIRTSPDSTAQPPQACGTCPRVCDAERLRRLELEREAE
ncbi:iron-sulfur protein [Streptomyces sp. YC504]|uniref:Iron-sulfur protein n=1 Tax=Streptomyces mesophilus TaxID=1775132 RepID=A0A6G4XIF5_9ACTN|nr:iron-sulfur protein [Streptomyces mesophilus]